MRPSFRSVPLALSILAACSGPRQLDATATTTPATPATPATSTRIEPAPPTPPTTESKTPSPDMPRELGGMRLGMSVPEFAEACRAKGAKDVPNERDQTVLCTIPPEPLLPRGATVPFDGVVLGAFCGPDTIVCGLTYVVYGKPSERRDQLGALLADLIRRYGLPAATEGKAAADPTRECAAGNAAVRFARSWAFGRGQIRLSFECDPRDGPRDASLLLEYDLR